MNVKKILVIVLGLFYSSLILGQSKYTISGQMRDASTGEDLLYSSVIVKENTKGCITNEYGFYSISLPNGIYTVKFSYMGYKTIIKKIKLHKDVKINVELEKSNKQLSEIKVRGKAVDANVTRNEIGTMSIKIEDAKELPVLLGEQDIIKTMQLMPGVSSSGEGGSGYHVRGGSIGQNLILLDEAPVYNASHLLGFFSVFNSDAIKDMKIYKGGTPAKYGGRSSSVLDLRMKDGNSKRFKASGGVGLLSSRLMLEGPIVKDKGSFMISGRRTYLDLFFPLANDSKVEDSKLYFYDVNIKANYRFGDKDRIFLSSYLGRDVFSYDNRMGFNWGNITNTIRWNHLFSNKFFVYPT